MKGIYIHRVGSSVNFHGSEPSFKTISGTEPLAVILILKILPLSNK